METSFTIIIFVLEILTKRKTKTPQAMNNSEIAQRQKWTCRGGGLLAAFDYRCTAWQIMGTRVWVSLCSFACSYLFVAQCSGGLQRWCRTQTAERPRLAYLWWFQGASTDGADVAQVGQVWGDTDCAQRLAIYNLQNKNERKCAQFIRALQLQWCQPYLGESLGFNT